MSFIKKVLEQISENAAMHSDGIHSGERLTKNGKLTSHPTVDNIDPVSLSDKETNDEFQKEVDKKVKGEAITQPSGIANHIHEFEMGDNRTSTDEGHDHSIVYKNGKPVKTGPGPEDGHIHLI